MALTSSISQKELQRIASLSYEGKTIKVMLCQVGTSGYTVESTVSNWQSVEKSGDGYARYTATIATGSYDAVDAQYEMPYIDASFTATGIGYNYESIAIYIDGESYLHSLITESPSITLSSGQTQTYRIQLATND